MKAYIDLGSHKGKTIRKFMKSWQYSIDCEIHAFEASPLLEKEVFNR